MFKRNSISTAFSAIIFTMLCLFPSVVGAQAAQEQQQKDPPPLKGSRSNINNNRTGGTRFDPIVVDLKKASGEKVLTSQIADLDNDGRISEAESVFDFDVLPAGDYVLTLSRLDGKINNLESDLSGRIHITGAVGGDVEKDWKLEAKASDVTSASQRLRGYPRARTMEDVSRQGNAEFKNVVLFKADGKMKVAGKITLRNGGVIIQDIRRPN